MAGPTSKIDTTKAIALASQGLSQRVIADTLGCSYAALRQWFARHKVSHKVSQVKIAVVENKDSGLLEKASQYTRNRLASEVMAQSDELSQAGLGLGNSDGRQGKSAILKTLVESADKLFGWSQEQPEVVMHFHALGQSMQHLALPASSEPITDAPQT